MAASRIPMMVSILIILGLVGSGCRTSHVFRAEALYALDGLDENRHVTLSSASGAYVEVASGADFTLRLASGEQVTVVIAQAWIDDGVLHIRGGGSEASFRLADLEGATMMVAAYPSTLRKVVIVTLVVLGFVVAVIGTLFIIALATGGFQGSG